MANPEDKEMKKQWITVEGRLTPVILPQIWDHDIEDWVVTSTDNPLPTQVTGSIVEDLPKGSLESKVYQRQGSMESMQDEDVVDIDGECTLQSLTIGTNTNKARILIYPKNSDGTRGDYLRIPTADGSRLFSVQPAVLQEASGENDFFSLKKYDTESNEFIIVMKRAATFGNGVLIRVGNQDDTEKNLSCNIMMVKMNGSVDK